MQTLITRQTRRAPSDEFRRLASSLIQRKNRTFAELRGQKLAVFANDDIGLEIFTHGVYEREGIADVFAVLDLLGVECGDAIAIDVGANIGNHTLLFAEKFSAVYSFEPNPHTFQLLNFNTQFTSNVVLQNIGISDKAEMLTLREELSNAGASSAVIDKNGKYEFQIAVKPLDDALPLLKKVRMIKIDVEGMELQVLRGAINTIVRNQPVIVFEQHDGEFHEGKESPSITFLRELGYEIYWPLQNSSWISRLRKASSILLAQKVKRKIITQETVPAGYYPLLIGVPQDQLHALGLSL